MAAHIAYVSIHAANRLHSSSMTAAEYFRQGATLAKQGLWKEGLAAYTEPLRDNLQNAETYLNLGFVSYERGYDQEAQEACDRASKLQARPCGRS